jgi:hypothetical protein
MHKKQKSKKRGALEVCCGTLLWRKNKGGASDSEVGGIMIFEIVMLPVGCYY